MTGGYLGQFSATQTGRAGTFVVSLYSDGLVEDSQSRVAQAWTPPRRWDARLRTIGLGGIALGGICIVGGQIAQAMAVQFAGGYIFVAAVLVLLAWGILFPENTPRSYVLLRGLLKLLGRLPTTRPAAASAADHLHRFQGARGIRSTDIVGVRLHEWDGDDGENPGAAVVLRDTVVVTTSDGTDIGYATSDRDAEHALAQFAHAIGVRLDISSDS